MPSSFLIDYDNILLVDRKKGLTYIVEKVLKLFNRRKSRPKNLVFRLYGGWYEHNFITALAQNLQIEINGSFPNTFVLGDNATKVIVRVELALSLTIEPSKLLFNTFRSRGYAKWFKSSQPIKCKCSM